ncbi:TPR-like protein [Rhizodiscina lignyota]|uniref:DNA-(apurinic or apyrimidinic site) lyase n=1 Tax=Rhizodiscina lignyota TaxID=1504668 RepID=A0A9P4M1F5_9PEZI|nr:TPR-like protein [Rhizodiscina lignyota]
MPEIGEVARIVHYLKKHVVGRTIAAVKVQDDPIVYGKVGTSAAEFKSAMTGKKVVGARQQGKYFWLEMSEPPHPLMHLGMTGWIRFSNDDTSWYKAPKNNEEEWPPRFWKFVLEMEGNPECQVAFLDARRLGRIRLVDAKAEEMRNTTPLKENGPDPVVDKDILTVEWLGAKMRKKKANISGVGNWVGDEVLFQARIHPEQYSNTFSDEQVERLHDKLIEVCTIACETLAESDRFPEDWLMKHRWKKGKKDSSTLPTGEKIIHLTVGGRTSAVVPSLQKKTGAVAGDVSASQVNGAVEDEEDDTEKKPKATKTKKGAKREKDEDDVDDTTSGKRTKRGKAKTEDADGELDDTVGTPASKKQKKATAVKDESAKIGTPKGTKGSKAVTPESGRRRSARPLPHKEQNLFRQVVKYYEAKQYKKALKAADQVLKKAPNHADTQAFKALTLNAQGQTEEAFALAKIALKNDTKSHICWHVYGLLYRSVKNLEEAIKAYKFALRLEPESQQIQRDLAFLQIQMRDYQGYIQSRRAMLNARPQVRQNWTGLAVAYHLSGDLQSAENMLKTYEGTLRSPPPRSDIEHSEASLYRNALIAEMDEPERALEHLESIAKNNLDRTAVMEMRADYLLRLDKKEEAEKAYRALIERNNEYRLYYEQLEKALGLTRTDSSCLPQLLELYDSYAKQNERLDAARRIPLDFLEGEQFKTATDSYLRRLLTKGVPSTFANIKALYRDPSKRDTIHQLVESYFADASSNGSADKSQANGDGHSDRFKQFVIYFLAQHYDYYLSRDLSKAMSLIDQAIELDPKSVDFHMTKARIHKHLGDSQKAAEMMNAARQLDERDRYINTKCAKYQLRNHENDSAIQTMSKFTRNETVGGPLGDLHDMQCMWYITEDGDSYLRQGKLALALKRYTAIADIFDTWTEDQFDFHGFSLRKGQVRSYVDMVKWEDHLRDHPFFARAGLSAVKIYIMLHDNPALKKSGGNINLTNGIGAEDLDNLDAAEKKKALKKAKREAERAEKAEQERKEAEARKNAGKKTTGGDGEPKKEDPDPQGLKLIKTEQPLEEAMRFLAPMLEFSPKRVDVQVLGCDVFLRRSKLLLALKCIRAAASIDPEDAGLHEQIVNFRKAVDKSPPTDPKLKAVLDATDDLIPASKDLASFNDAYLKKHAESATQVRAGLNVRHLLDPNSKNQNEKDLIATIGLDGTDLTSALEGLGLLSYWKSDKSARSAYMEKARARWPEATVFKSNA